MALLLALCLVLGHAQQPTRQTDLAKEVLTLRSASRLVQLNVIVNDSRGNPVPGLHKEDFTLFVDKKRQPIQVFSAETGDSRNSGEEMLDSPDVYRNTAIHGVENATIILLDQLNTEPADQSFADAAVVNFLREIRPEDRVALYCLGGDLRVIQDFGADRTALYQAALRLRPQSNRGLANSVAEDPVIDNPNSSLPAGQTSNREAYRRVFAQRAANASTTDRVRQTVAAFIAIANHIGSVPGRKNLVWISGSFPFDLGYEKFDLDWASHTGVQFGTEIEKAAEALSSANIAIYPVDAHGLVEGGMGAKESGTPDQTPVDADPLAGTESMETLADRTGGRAYYNTNNIAGAIRHALDDSRASYTLGYYPVHLRWDGSFHRLQVKVRTPRTEVRARSGFFALPDRLGTNDVTAMVEQTAQLNATGIGLSVHVQTAPGLQPTLIAKLAFNLEQIQIRHQGENWSGSVETAFVQLDDRGKVVGKDDRIFNMKFGPPEYQDKPSGEITTSETVHVLPHVAQVCVVVRDTSTHRFGSVLIPVEKYLPGHRTN